MPHQLKSVVGKEMRDIDPTASEEVIQADYLVAFIDQAFAKMGAEEARAASDENAHSGATVQNPGALASKSY